MYKINLTPFTVLIRTKEGEQKEIPYGLTMSLCEVLFNPALRLNGVNLLKQNILAQKILNCTENELLLENSEYQELKNAFEKIEGLSRNDVIMCQRVLEATPIEVQEK